MTNRRRTCRSIRRNGKTEIVSRTDRRCVYRRRRKNFHTSHFVREKLRRTLRKMENRPSWIRKKDSCHVNKIEISEMMSGRRSESDLLQTRRNIQWSTERKTTMKRSQVMMSCNPPAFIFCTIDERNQRICRNVISDHLQQVQRPVGRVCCTANDLWTGDEVEGPSKRRKTANHWSECILILIWIFVDDTRCEEVQTDWMTAWILSDDIDWRLTWTCKKIYWRAQIESSDLHTRDHKKPMWKEFYFVNKNHARPTESTISSSE